MSKDNEDSLERKVMACLLAIMAVIVFTFCYGYSSEQKNLMDVAALLGIIWGITAISSAVWMNDERKRR